jgi:cell division protein ZapA
MCKVRDAGKIKARDRIAVLAALNLAFEQAEAPPAAVSQVVPTENAAALSDADSDRLGQLLKKLDQALHQDGQLI